MAYICTKMDKMKETAVFHFRRFLTKSRELELLVLCYTLLHCRVCADLDLRAGDIIDFSQYFKVHVGIE